MCNEDGALYRLSFNSQSLFEIQKELAETEDEIRDLERKKSDARAKGEKERLSIIEDWLQMLHGKAIRLRSEIAACENLKK